MKKIPFDLTTWLQDKSQKVETRDGRPVRILCTDCKSLQPIVALVQTTEEHGVTVETVENYTEQGRYFFSTLDSDLDLFLVTEDEPLTEFEEAVGDLCWRVGMGEAVKDASQIKREADRLFSIARKQIEKEIYGSIQAEMDKHHKRLEDTIDGKIALDIWNKQRTPSPALTRIVESLTPEKLEQTKKEMEHDIWVEAYCEGEKHGMEVGRKQVLQGLPKWKKADVIGTDVAELNNLPLSVYHGGYRIDLSDLEKLPKE